MPVVITAWSAYLTSPPCVHDQPAKSNPDFVNVWAGKVEDVVATIQFIVPTAPSPPLNETPAK